MKLNEEEREKITHSQDTSYITAMEDESILSVSFILKGYL